MSIAVLTQVYDEMRRLAIAGSVTAGGDFRLKRLIPPLEQAGTKAPVFARVAQAVKTLVEGTEQTSASALLELSTLVNAVLYTQGETGLAGKWAEIVTTDLGPQTSQVSASVLKPLLEALTTTGSGRLEVIKESFQRGAFRDLRLVKPAIDAIDDSYGEIADFIAKNVLALYGTAILPDLKSRFDLKSGKAGHVRRLALMHQLDPVGTRELVKQALENGSKEIKLVAIECLGDSSEDLAFLLEQSSAKTKEIRRAALKALAKLDSDEVFETLKKALTGNDLDIAIQPVQQSRNAKLRKFVIDEGGRQLEALFKTKNTSKEKNEVGKGVERFVEFLSSLEGRDDKAAEEFLITLFQRQEEIQSLKGEPGGVAINDRVAELMAKGSKKLQIMLAETHANLTPDALEMAFQAAHKSMSPSEVFDMFSPYLRVKAPGKKKGLDPAWVKREAIIEGLGAPSEGYHSVDELNRIYEDGTWDPRWLDVAVEIGHVDLTCRLARSTHQGCKEFLSNALDAESKAPQISVGIIDILKTMLRIEHPDATASLIQMIKKMDSNKHGYYGYWIWQLTGGLPKTAVAPLEALIPSLREETADQLMRALIDLKNKP